MTTLEFMAKELYKCKTNLEQEISRNAPKENIENIKTKISHYEKVCELLKGRKTNE
jgi:hypothetical protein